MLTEHLNMKSSIFSFRLLICKGCFWKCCYADLICLTVLFTPQCSSVLRQHFKTYIHWWLFLGNFYPNWESSRLSAMADCWPFVMLPYHIWICASYHFWCPLLNASLSSPQNALLGITLSSLVQTRWLQSFRVISTERWWAGRVILLRAGVDPSGLSFNAGFALDRILI